MVCPDDFEVRHPLDFYRSRNDSHKLDFIRSDTPADPQATWTSTVANLAITASGAEVGTINNVGNYKADGLTGLTRAVITVSFAKPGLVDATINLPVTPADSTTTATSATFTLPTVPTTAGNFTVINDRGEFIKKGTVSAGNSTVSLGSWTKKRGGLLISAVYGT